MTLEDLRQEMPAYAKDTKLNLGRVLAADGVDGLSPKQTFSIALASAFATRRPEVMDAVSDAGAAVLADEDIEAAKAAATVMGMNNVYYRFIHLVSDDEYGRMPANLRMNIIGDPGIDKVTFELMCLAVSAINGCGMCIDSHVGEVTKGGVSRQGVQSCIRIAAVLSAAAQALAIEDQ